MPMREDLAHQLELAIHENETQTVRSLIDQEPRLTGTPIPVQRDWGEEMWLGLHLAAEAGRAEIARLLLDANASVDARTRFRTPMHARQTALMLASAVGHAEIVKQLLAAQADVSLLDANHRSPLSMAAEAGHSSIIAQLIDAHAPIDPVDDQQRTPLHWAIAGGHVDAALALIDAGADLDHRCPKEPAGFTPLHRATALGEPLHKIVDKLINAGADTTLRDPRHGKTASELKA